LIALAVAALPFVSVSSAEAKGCIKGAIVGGVAGHYAGHHGMLGAAAGCLYGRHRAHEQERQQDQNERQSQRQPSGQDRMWSHPGGFDLLMPARARPRALVASARLCRGHDDRRNSSGLFRVFFRQTTERNVMTKPLVKDIKPVPEDNKSHKGPGSTPAVPLD